MLKDLYSLVGTKTWGILGTTGSRIFVLRYAGIPYFSGTVGLLTCDVLLYEADSTVEIRYYSVLPHPTDNVLVGIYVNPTPRGDGTVDYVSFWNARPLTTATASYLQNSTLVFRLTRGAALLYPSVPTSMTLQKTTSSVSPPMDTPLHMVNLVDTQESWQNIGFSFYMYGMRFTAACITKYGTLQFTDDTVSSVPAGFPINDDTKLPIISAFATDFSPISASTIGVVTTGTYPNRIFTFRMLKVPYQPTASAYGLKAGYVSLDVNLLEINSSISITYYHVDTSAQRVVIGTQNSTNSRSMAMSTAYDPQDYTIVHNYVVITPTVVADLVNFTYNFLPRAYYAPPAAEPLSYRMTFSPHVLDGTDPPPLYNSTVLTTTGTGGSVLEDNEIFFPTHYS